MNIYFREPKLIIRERIEAILEHIFYVPLFVVIAPIGYGKTTEIRNFLEKQKEIDIIPFIFQNNETDISWIWQQISNTMRKSENLIMKKVSEMPFPYTKQDRIRLVELMRIGFEKPTIFLLDDYHICKSSYLDSIIEELSLAAIKNLHIIIIGRTAPDFPYEEMVLKSTCTVMEQQDLTWTKEEMVEFFFQNDCFIDEKESDILYEYTDGWISAIYLATLEYMKNGKIDNLKGVTHLIKTSLFDRLQEEEQELLSIMSPFDAFCAEQAIYITGISDCPRILQSIKENSSFVRYNIERKVFEVHSLLKSVTKDELINRGYKEEDIVERCARWYQKEGRLIDAIQSYSNIKKFETIFSILEREGCYLLYESALRVFIDFYKQVPMELRMAHIKPYIGFIYYYRLVGEVEKGEELFCSLIDYYEKYIKPIAAPEIEGEIMVLKSIMAFNDIKLMCQNIKKANELLGKKGSTVFHSKMIINNGVPENIRLYYNKSGKLKEIVFLEKEYTKYYSKVIKEEDAGWDWLFEAEYELLLGNMEKAVKLAEQARKKSYFKKRSCVIISSCFVLLRGYIYLGKKKEFEETIEFLKKLMIQEQRTILLLDYDLALSHIWACLKLTEKMPIWIKKFHFDQCNNMVKSVRLGCSSYGAYLISQKEYVELEALSELMLSEYNQKIHIFVLFYGKIFQSIAYYYLYSIEKAVESMKQAIDLLKDDKIVFPFAEYVDEVLPILEHIDTLYVKEITYYCKQYKIGRKKILEDTVIVKEKREFKVPLLTAREMDIIRLVKAGYKNVEISETLHIAIVTVEKNLSSIYKKLGVKNRTMALLKLEEEFNEMF